MRETMLTIDALPVGGRVWFAEHKQPYTVQARSRRFLVCTKPFAARRTVMYTVVDLKERIRGTENLVFGMGAESREDCEAMIDRLEGRDKTVGFTTEVSHRNYVPLNVVRTAAVRPPARGTP